VEPTIPIEHVHTLVVGSGAASLNAAVRLKRAGIDDLLVVTPRLEAGTSRNTGSDKQTYCRVSETGPEPDSVLGLARALFSGGGMHGDIALAEASGSLRSFYNLVELGVEVSP
jgi:succinate dehydrogenase/fumarate reductase flavoprotein subunit